MEGVFNLAPRQPIRSEVPKTQNAVGPALPAGQRCPLEGVARSAAGVG